MAATAQNPFAALSSRASAHPTMTEHDFRFPRRPANANAVTGGPRPDRFNHGDARTHTHAPATGFHPTVTSTIPPTTTAMPMAAATTGRKGSHVALHDLRLDVPAPLTHGGGAHHDLLRAAAFPPFQHSSAASFDQSLDGMQRQDPLATQIWKFYAKTKQALPAQERMENLTWRMMYPRLRQEARVANAAR